MTVKSGTTDIYIFKKVTTNKVSKKASRQAGKEGSKEVRK
jgi:hypothetical protein